MITAEHEQARTGTGKSFADVVAVDFCDPEHELFGLVWMTRLPGANLSRASAMVFSKAELVEDLELEREGTMEDWDGARLDGVLMATERPLERWSVTARGKQASLELEAESLTAPREVASRELAEMTGVEQYEQLCGLSGTVDVAGRTYPVRCLGRRVHRWGAFAWDAVERWRTLYGVSLEGHAVSVAAALPSDGEGHERELRSASYLDVDDGVPFEDVRVSTVFTDDGFPTKVGVELWQPAEEFPRRLGGEVICGVRTGRAGHDLVVSFFRWSIEGEPAYGCYELVRRA